MNISLLPTLFLIIHLFGVAIGAGGAFISDGIFFTSVKDKRISKDEFGIIKYSSYMTWFGLLLLILSGIGLFALNPAVLSHSTKFLVKMTIIGVLVLNGIVFHLVHLPFIRKHVGEFLIKKNKPNNMDTTPFLLSSGVVSITSWTLAIILGALTKIPFSYLGALSLYVGIISLGILVSLILFFKFIDRKNLKKVFSIGLASLGLSLILLILSLM